MLKTLEYWKEKGFIDEPVEDTIDIKKEIRKMCEEKNAIILAHYYTIGDIQDVADFVRVFREVDICFEDDVAISITENFKEPMQIGQI